LAQKEFSKVKTRDQRLKKRCQKIASDWNNNRASPSTRRVRLDGYEAAYRFFDNPKVTPDKILAAHRGRTVQRMKGYEQVLAIQDTSFLSTALTCKRRDSEKSG